MSPYTQLSTIESVNPGNPFVRADIPFEAELANPATVFPTIAITPFPVVVETILLVATEVRSPMAPGPAESTSEPGVTGTRLVAHVPLPPGTRAITAAAGAAT